MPTIKMPAKFCVISPVVRDGRTWLLDEAAAVTHAQEIMGRAPSIEEFYVVRVVRVVRRKPVAPVNVFTVK